LFRRITAHQMGCKLFYSMNIMSSSFFLLLIFCLHFVFLSHFLFVSFLLLSNMMLYVLDITSSVYGQLLCGGASALYTVRVLVEEESGRVKTRGRGFQMFNY